jgi:hypothetical protein
MTKRPPARLSDFTWAYWTIARGAVFALLADKAAGAGESRASAIVPDAVSTRTARRASDGFMLGSFCRDPAPILLLARNRPVTVT